MKQTGAGIFLSVIAFALPFVSVNTILYPDVSSKYFFVVITTLILALWGSYLLYKGQLTLTRTNQWLLAGLAVVLVAQYASAFSGIFLERSLWSDIYWSTGAFFLTHLAILAVLLGNLLSKKDWSSVRKSIIVSSGILGFLSILGVGGFAVVNHVLWIPLAKVHLTFGNETYAGAYLFLAFVVGLIEYFNTPKESKWRLGTLIALVCTALSPLLLNIGLLFGKTPLMDVFSHPVLLLGSARASSAAFIALLVFTAGFFLIRRFIKGNTKTPAILLWSAALLLGAGIGVVLLFTPGSAVQNAYIESSSAARVILWDASVKAFEARPLLGWGPENFSYAIAQYFDNRLFQEQNLAEIWFDRAHNVFLDTLTTQGVVGFLAFTLLILLYLRTVYRAKRKEVISDIETAILYALVPLHLLQMQTGFDTVGSYTLLALMLGYAFFLERQSAVGESTKLSAPVAKGLAVVLVLLSLVSFKVMVLDEYARESALLTTLTAKTAEEQKQAIERSLSRVSAFEAMRISYASFLNGSLASIAKAPSPQKTAIVLEFIKLYEAHFEKYIEVQPDYYRARVNYAYLLLIQTALGEDRTAEAKAIIKDSYRLSPGNPLTYILDSVAELYSGNIKEADRLMQEALAINPHVEFTQEAAQWLQAQKKSFPNISVLRIKNL